MVHGVECCIEMPTILTDPLTDFFSILIKTSRFCISVEVITTAIKAVNNLCP